MEFADLKVGQRASVSKIITDDDIRTIAEVTTDRNPLHLDDEFARMSRFGRRVAHGVLAIGLVSAVLGTQLPGPGTIYLSQQIKFLAPVYPGDTVTASVKIMQIRPDKRIVVLKTECHNQKGQALLMGEAVVLVDNISIEGDQRYDRGKTHSTSCH